MGGVMVESSVDYVDKEVEAAEEEEEDQREIAWKIDAVLKLSIPIVSTVFALLFLSNVVGRIALSNLYYPLFVMGLLLVLLASIYVTELQKIYAQYQGTDVSTKANAARLWEEWKQSVWLLVAAVAYLYIVPILGFFIASFIGMIVIMLIGGYTNWRRILPTTVGVLLLIYVLFVVVANLSPPEGIFGF